MMMADLSWTIGGVVVAVACLILAIFRSLDQHTRARWGDVGHEGIRPVCTSCAAQVTGASSGCFDGQTPEKL